MNRQPEPLSQDKLNEEGCRQLILAVLKMAIWDATQPSWDRASDAISFFFGDALDFYTELLGINAETFRKTLLTDMFSNDETDEICLEQKMQFRINHMRWSFSPVDLFGMVLR